MLQKKNIYITKAVDEEEISMHVFIYFFGVSVKG